MPFAKGNKLAKGGKRRGAGRPAREKAEFKKLVGEMAVAFIARHTKEVLDTYLKNARGRYETRVTASGKKVREWVVDAPTTRHWVDRFVPAPQQQIELTGADGGAIEVEHDFPHGEYRRLFGQFLAETAGAGAAVHRGDGAAEPLHPAHSDGEAGGLS